MLLHSVGSGNSQASENSNFGTTVVLLITHDIITYHHSGAPKLEKKRPQGSTQHYLPFKG